MSRVERVRTAQGQRVWWTSKHADAIDEACRRLRVMHEKWPETRWRCRVVSERHRDVRRWRGWAVYVRIDDSGA